MASSPAPAEQDRPRREISRQHLEKSVREALERSRKLLRETDAMVDPLRSGRPLVRTIRLPG